MVVCLCSVLFSHAIAMCVSHYHEPIDFTVTWVYLILGLGSEYHVEHFLSGPPVPLVGTPEEIFGFYGALLRSSKSNFFMNGID